ncbi:MAG: phosphate signaling complex protein PhoU [Zoogloeaceae bacterium]|jgi:phosphate transport system protein|nr:phosphate signaling complex protein PhoU [Zoogloeaceae bacterium]
MNDRHLASQFDEDLNVISSKLMEMGGLVEMQIKLANQALKSFSVSQIDDILEAEDKVDLLEVDIDRELATITVRRQPAARDLRLLMAISKITTNLERTGDEASKIAKRIRSIVETGEAREIALGDLHSIFDKAADLIHRVLDAFARLDVVTAVTIHKEDDQIDHEFKGFTRKLITHMMEDPRTIRSCQDLLFIAKAVERIGDHAKNISEFIIYIVKGMDVRHSALTHVDIDSVVQLPS